MRLIDTRRHNADCRQFRRRLLATPPGAVGRPFIGPTRCLLRPLIDLYRSAVKGHWCLPGSWSVGRISGAFPAVTVLGFISVVRLSCGECDTVMLRLKSLHGFVRLSSNPVYSRITPPRPTRALQDMLIRLIMWYSFSPNGEGKYATSLLISPLSSGRSGLAVACLTAVREVLGSNRAVGSCVYRKNHCD